MVKNLPAMQETWVQSLGWDDPLKKGMATHSSILAWRIPWEEERGRLQSMGCKQPDTIERRTHTHTHTHTHTCFVLQFPDSNTRWRHYITKTHAAVLAYDSRSLEFLLFPFGW